MLYSSEANLGVGISYMNAIGEQIENNLNEFDFIEAYSERFFIKDDNSRLRRIIKNKPLVLHGLDLSIGCIPPIIPPITKSIKTR